MKRQLQTFTLLWLMASFPQVHAEVSVPDAEVPDYIVDWSRIRHWAGEGENRAALIVQFHDDPWEQAYVWGYRWNTPKEEYDDDNMPVVSGETMFRAIAAASIDLDLFTQYTGEMGSTVCGIGYSERHSVMDYVKFDFDAARADTKISFNYLTPSGGQTEAPGMATPEICRAAIEEARITHILDHPLNAAAYGYPAYDYDHWGDEELDDFSIDYALWQHGWYDGYWAFLTGNENTRRLAYSGVGMSGVALTDGAVHAWVFTPLDRSDGEPLRNSASVKVTYPLEYDHWELPLETGITSPTIIGNSCEYTPDTAVYCWYDIQGREVAVTGSPKTPSALAPGLYVARGCGKTLKIFKK